ncbi:hypothetical protein KP509_20G086600 [Ceratopteris richardii]|uniref:Uncharacterized protein n=1 Tax=Ceratopteris richardii TaxID=49495 RepID=A0A8T2SH09_CERRI|nr:hypothetical protein KP509_20G086600 [Ceratopteris richardii]
MLLQNIEVSNRSDPGKFGKRNCVLSKTGVEITKSRVAECHSRWKKPVTFSSLHNEEKGKSARKSTTKLDSINSSEVDELKRRLRETNTQMAEMIAQSAIFVRDIQDAASKKIADASHCTLSKEIARNCTLLPSTQIGRVHEQPEVVTLEVELAVTKQELEVTKQELANCKCLLGAVRRELEQTSYEKAKLETCLRSSLKLQNSLVNQRAHMQLELMAAQDRWRNESARLVQSARDDAKCMREKLDAALASKAESDSLLRDCVQLLCYTQKELLQFKASRGQGYCFESAVQNKYQEQEVAEEQVKEQVEKFMEICAQNMISWTVLQCIWEGAVQSLVHRCSVNSEIPALSTEKLKQKRFHAMRHGCASGEDVTPIKRAFMETPTCSCYMTEEDGEIGLKLMTLDPKDCLQQNLIKSEQEVVLGDKVDELRAILKKVTLLLDCISKSSVTRHETRIFMKRIIEQLQSFEV